MPPRVEALSAVVTSRPVIAALTAHVSPRGATAQRVASFSTTSSRPRFAVNRRKFMQWMKGPVAKELMYPSEEGEPKYIDYDFMTNRDRPFPHNRTFRSQPVLDERSRELIWSKIMRDGETVKAVSVEFGVDILRVAAVVRLKEVEKDFEAKRKPMAKPYAKAVLSMLPTHTIEPGVQNPGLENINEVHIHPHSMQQIFYPTSESRHFTREDAAKTFSETLLPVDKRVPHPELVQMARDTARGTSPWKAGERFKKAVMESERRGAEKKLKRAAAVEKTLTHTHSNRFEFRFRDYNSEQVGRGGRSRTIPGWKYGVGFYDRHKGEIKIPTSVP